MILTDERKNGRTFVATCSFATPKTTVDSVIDFIHLADWVQDPRRQPYLASG